MSTSQQYEEAFILYNTMTYIQAHHQKCKGIPGKVECFFEIRCSMSNYEVGNHSLRKRHSELFKSDDYHFYPTNELVKSMPFQCIQWSSC